MMQLSLAGCLSALCFLSPVALAQEGDAHDPFAGDGAFDSGDPFATDPGLFRKGKVKAAFKESQDEVAVLIEMIEVDHLVVNDLILRFGQNANHVGEMRDALMKLVKGHKAILKETLWGRSILNKKAKISAVVEKIYPTEYEPPELPQIVVQGGTELKKSSVGKGGLKVEIEGDAYLPATPTTFDTKLIGTTLEFEATRIPNNKEQIGLAILLEIIRFLGNDHYVREGLEEEGRGISNITMPRFGVNSQEFLVNVVPGKHCLLGIYKQDDAVDKRIVILLRAEVIAKK